MGEKNSIGTVKASPFNNAHLEGKKIFYDQKENVSLVLISLVEGMRHQIRVQTSSSGHPIVGDPLYVIDLHRLVIECIYMLFVINLNSIKENFQ